MLISNVVVKVHHENTCYFLPHKKLPFLKCSIQCCHPHCFVLIKAHHIVFSRGIGKIKSKYIFTDAMQQEMK